MKLSTLSGSSLVSSTQDPGLGSGTLLLATGKLPELKGELNLVIYEFHNDKL